MQQEWSSDDFREDPSAKRARYDPSSAYGNGHGGYGQKVQSTGRSEMSTFEERSNPAPSPVVHIRNLPDSATEHDISDAASKFGSVRAAYVFPGKRMGLVEFEHMQEAMNLVKNQGLRVQNVDTLVNYSTSQKINRPTTEEQKPHNILLMTVLNPRYPIDVDVIHKISSPHGQVLRIVIFRKHGAVQAMAEFDSVESAVRAKSYLNGADIYSGCCTLKIEFAKTNTLQVSRNDKETWDYTRETIAEPTRPPPLLEKPAEMSQPPSYQTHGDPYGVAPSRDYASHSQPPVSAYDQRAPVYEQGRGGGGYDQYQRPSAPPPASSYDRQPASYDRRNSPPGGGAYGGDRGRDYGRDAPPPRDGYGGGYGGRQDSRDSYGSAPHREDRGGSYNDSRGGGGGGGGRYESGPGRGGPGAAAGYGGGHGGGGDQGTSVAMLYGLEMSKFNCDRLFNLFCLYGNIQRIKFLKSKEGSAMVQMGDSVSLRRAIENLHGLTIFGSKIPVTPSRQAALNDVPNPYNLADGSVSYKDYSGARNNRFTTPEQASKNRITPPTRCLHFFNAPAGSSEEEVENVFVDKTGRKPGILTVMHGKSERSVSGFVEYDTIEEAVETLILVNHTELPNKSNAKGAFPYIFKVCFTNPNGARGGGPGGSGGGGGGGGRGRGDRGGDGGGGRGGRD